MVKSAMRIMMVSLQVRPAAVPPDLQQKWMDTEVDSV
jgi:hypothetical protein